MFYMKIFLAASPDVYSAFLLIPFDCVRMSDEIRGLNQAWRSLKFLLVDFFCRRHHIWMKGLSNRIKNTRSFDVSARAYINTGNSLALNARFRYFDDKFRS